MPNNILDSYLVELGTQIDEKSFRKMQDTLLGAAKTTSSVVTGIAGDFLKWQIAGVTAFSTVGFGVVGYIDKLAMADQKTKMLAMQNMMSVQQYRAVSSALDVLGVSLDDVFFGTKELQDRFHMLVDDQKQLATMIGPGYEKQMEQVRDLRFQLSRLELKGQYFGMKFASDLLTKLGFGDGGITAQLERLNDFVLSRMPEWSDELSTDIIPILHDFVGMVKDIGNILGVAANAFVNFEATLTGDSSLEGKTTSFHQFATAVGDAAHQVAYLLHLLFDLEKIAANTGAFTVHGWASLFTMDQSKIDKLTGQQTDDLHATWGGIKDLWHDLTGGKPAYDGGGVTTPKPAAAGGANTDAFAVAQSVSKRTGIPADLIYGQMAFETGNFAHLAGKNNMSGIKVVGTNTFRDFESIDKYADYYASTLGSGRYKNNGVANARTGADFAHALKTPTGTYYGKDDERAYGAGVERYRKAYDISVGSITVNVPATAHTPEQITNMVKQGVAEGLAEHNQTMMAETAGAYQ